MYRVHYLILDSPAKRKRGPVTTCEYWGPVDVEVVDGDFPGCSRSLSSSFFATNFAGSRRSRLTRFGTQWPQFTMKTRSRLQGEFAFTWICYLHQAEEDREFRWQRIKETNVTFVSTGRKLFYVWWWGGLLELEETSGRHR